MAHLEDHIFLVQSGESDRIMYAPVKRLRLGCPGCSMAGHPVFTVFEWVKGETWKCCAPLGCSKEYSIFDLIKMNLGRWDALDIIYEGDCHE